MLTIMQNKYTPENIAYLANFHKVSPTEMHVIMLEDDLLQAQLFVNTAINKNDKELWERTCNHIKKQIEAITARPKDARNH